MPMIDAPLAEVLAGHHPRTAVEAVDLSRARALAGAAADPWLRSTPLHATASALIVHPPTGRVLLRGHTRERAWPQMGGHGEAGESAPLAIALREAREETGLRDLTPWPDASLLQVAVVPVAARVAGAAQRAEPAHEHADLRFVFATAEPEGVRAENADARLRWLTPAEARALTSQPHVRDALGRVERLLATRGGGEDGGRA
ncbi:NUDIX domain-containing protein [Streptomyces sp. NBC_01497]|uniref:NUDIX domain-containing protein n=1 Tax=Streptomyces sp. NBC_01497 TaxID=2903885 RepID=UPI002E36A58D|nr:NUDIX domain-containing protein [Streptomyces sp. NBC_01497]